MQTITEIKSSLSEVSQSILSGSDLYELICQDADGSSDVIYYYNAKCKVEAANCSQIEAAEEQFNEFDMRFESLSDLHCKIAYFLVVEELTEEYNDSIKSDIDELYTRIDEYKCEHKHDIELDERVEEIEDLIDTLEAV